MIESEMLFRIAEKRRKFIFLSIYNNVIHLNPLFIREFFWEIFGNEKKLVDNNVP